MTDTATSPEQRNEAGDFLALVCADPEWVLAEFDAIIAAGWDCEVDGGARCRRFVPPPRRRARSVTPRTCTVADNTELTARGRQRSPPATARARLTADE